MSWAVPRAVLRSIHERRRDPASRHVISSRLNVSPTNSDPRRIQQKHNAPSEVPHPNNHRNNDRLLHIPAHIPARPRERERDPRKQPARRDHRPRVPRARAFRRKQDDVARERGHAPGEDERSAGAGAVGQDAGDDGEDAGGGVGRDGEELGGRGGEAELGDDGGEEEDEGVCGDEDAVEIG